MIVRYSVSCGGGECVGVPEPDGEYVVFVPDGVVCDVLYRGHVGMVECADRSGIRFYKAKRYTVYVFNGVDWVKVWHVNSWLTEVDSILRWRPAIYVEAGEPLSMVSDSSRRFLLEKVATRENCKKYGCVTDFYKAWRPREGETLINLIDWAITVKRWRYFGVA